jgi:hypothetical protein
MTVRRRVYIVSSLVLALVLLGGGYAVLKHRSSAKNCDFPDVIRQTTSLKLYCPNPKQLPAGVVVDLSKASASSAAVIYPITDSNTTLSVSLQQKPTTEQLTNFVTNIIPLHFDANTRVGKGYIGVTNQGQSLLDLPTNNSNTWILVTGPKDYDSRRLKQIAETFQRSE